jgi:hypothetical protein
MTQQPSSQPDATTGRYPLSFTQEYFHSLDEGDLNGAFGNRFTMIWNMSRLVREPDREWRQLAGVVS